MYHVSLDKLKIPSLSKSNDFTYPPVPAHLPKLDIITERLISQRLPLMSIHRLRHGNGQYGILGQIINVPPVEFETMVNVLPRELDNDCCINVYIKKKKIHESSYLRGLVRKGVVKAWLRHLKNLPLYRL